MKNNSFKQFCVENNYDNLLDLWDYDLNQQSPDEVTRSSSKKIWFKCPRGIHESRQIMLGNVSKSYIHGKPCCICHKCNSIGQFIIDNYGEEYLNNIWSNKNTVSYFDIEKSSKNTIWLRCMNDNSHPDYDISANNFHKSHSCPYCIGKRTCFSNSFGSLYPELSTYWSDKNNISPYECPSMTNTKYYFKCENNIHDDYLRSVSDQIRTKYLCPECYSLHRRELYPRGEKSPFWKGDAVSKNRRARDSWEYNNWRKSVFANDNYTCQCCGKYSGYIQAHHIYNFAEYEDLRYELSNGITMCKDCHDANIKGSFHNIYGTHGKTPEELEQYINHKRKELGIDIQFSLEEYLNGKILKYDDFKTVDPPWIFDTIRKCKLENNYSLIAI